MYVCIVLIWALSLYGRRLLYKYNEDPILTELPAYRNVLVLNNDVYNGNLPKLETAVNTILRHNRPSCCLTAQDASRIDE